MGKSVYLDQDSKWLLSRQPQAQLPGRFMALNFATVRYWRKRTLAERPLLTQSDLSDWPNAQSTWHGSASKIPREFDRRTTHAYRTVPGNAGYSDFPCRIR